MPQACYRYDAVALFTNPARETADAGLHSVHTSNLPELLRRLHVSLVITTYQAGRVILVRARGDSLNTHFITAAKPMGLAARAGLIALGTTNEVIEYRNVPAVADKMPSPTRPTACYVPARRHITGDIDIHEMAFADAELWLVNTLFSCLCTLDDANSFVPRWRPFFVSAYAPEDRCHLNGLATRDGRAAFATALAASDTAHGWRAQRYDGGVLLDVQANELIAEKLCMPHSPRWHAGKLWLLESGKGTLASVTATPHSGHVEEVCQLPGFTRGLDFHDRFAFVGLSQVRESASFKNLPLVSRDFEQSCGVWVVDIESGDSIGFLKFDGAVREIFAVHVISDSIYPVMLDPNDPLVNTTYVLPEAAMQEVEFCASKVIPRDG